MGGTMRGFAHWLVRCAAGVAAGGLVVTGFGLAPAAAQSGSGSPAPAAGTPALAAQSPVSPVPETGTPALAPTGSTEQVRQLVQCGGFMFAVGTFTEISQSGVTYRRSNVFSFSATAPYMITSWTPSVNGTVNSIALTSSCTHAYIGGSFSKVDGVGANNIAYIRTYNNTLVKAFAHRANNKVNTVLLTPQGHLLVGGQFTSVNGGGHAYYASLNPSTGKDDGYLNLHISGHYVYSGVAPNGTSVYNQQLAPDGDYVLAEGVFTSVQGLPRQQIFLLHLAASAGNVRGWTSSEFSQHCADGHPFYVKAAAWSSDGLTVYVADTGFHPLDWNKTFPLTGLCDAVAAFPSTLAPVSHQWINYTGCDSLYSVAADSGTVYVGGHERWANNANGCNVAGPGAVSAPGMGGFTTSGTLLENSAGTAGRYSRGRGLGADDMLVTQAGLWIASDNLDGSDTCGGVSGFAGICFLRY
jgi:hypothetical protein